MTAPLLPPLVSVVVPVYNTAPYLPACLDSLLAQTYTRMEILCVNDGSSDNSLEILRDYAGKDSRIRIIDQPNSGPAAARNVALDVAAGDYVGGLDSDDCWEPQLLEKAVQALEPGADMVVFDAQFLMEDGSVEDAGLLRSCPKGAVNMTPRLAAVMPVAFWDKLWRRSFLDEHSLRMPRGLIFEDESFYCMACLHARRVCIAETNGYLYRQRADSIMGETRKKPDSLQYICNAEYVFGSYRAILEPSAEQRLIFIQWLGRLLEEGIRGCDEREYGEIRTRAQRLAHELSDGRRDFILDNLMHLPLQRGGGLFLSCSATRRSYRVFGIPLLHVRMSRRGMRVRPF